MGPEVALSVLLGGIISWVVGTLISAAGETLVDPERGTHYGTTREYGFKHSNAERSWLYRHYGVPYEKHGRLYLEPSPVNNRLGLAHEVGPGDDGYFFGQGRGGLTVNLYHASPDTLK